MPHPSKLKIKNSCLGKCTKETIRELRDYEQEGNIEVYRADDSIDCYGDCNGTGHHELRCNNVKNLRFLCEA